MFAVHIHGWFSGGCSGGGGHPIVFLNSICSCVQDPDRPAAVNSGQKAAMQHKTPSEGLCGTHTLSAQSDAKDANLNPDPGLGSGRVALAPPSPHPSLQSPLTSSDYSAFPPPSSARPHPDSSGLASGLTPLPAQPKRPPRVEVRMIDFAHSTFKGFRGDTAVHDGPDRGYVFGLESLVQILESLRDDNSL